jgi:hypothetical protein
MTEATRDGAGSRGGEADTDRRLADSRRGIGRSGD